MPVTFENYLEQIHSNEYYQTAIGATRQLQRTEKLDPATADHSSRTSRMCQVLGFAAGLSIGTATALAIGAELHDTGKQDCLDIVTSNVRLTSTTKARIEEHPLGSLKFTEQIFADNKSLYIPRVAGILAVGHHSHHKDARLNYPPAHMMGLKQHEINILQYIGPLLAFADTIEALTNPMGRLYRQARMAHEGTIVTQGTKGIPEAVTYAEQHLVRPDTRFNLDGPRIAELLMQQAEFLGQPSLAA